MRRLLAVTITFVTTVLLPPVAHAGGFSYGVASAEVRPSSAILWTRAPKAGKVSLEIALDRHFRSGHATKLLRATSANDLTAQTRAAGLTPARRYYYVFHEGRQRSAIGTFVTAPRPTAAKTVRFAVTGDTDGFKVGGTPFYNTQGFYSPTGSNGFAVFARMAAEKNDFNVNLGDTIYSEAPEKSITEDVPLGPTAFDLAGKRAKYRLNLSYPKLQKVRSSASMYNHWDDHEFNDDFTPNSAACMYGRVFTADSDAAPCDEKKVYAAGGKAFREYMPVTYSTANGIYRSFRWGRNVELFFLDERSFRSIHASEVKVDPSAPEPTSHVCDNSTGDADPAPQVPQRIRDLFGFVYPPASEPVPPACIAALDDSGRTMLGKRQYDAFTAAIRRSTATWKVIVNEVPLMGIYINPYDAWQGYSAERQKLLQFLHDNVKNAVVLTTDFHSNWVDDARFTTFPEEGGARDSGVTEFIGGGVADGTFGYEIDDFTNKKDQWKPINDLFYAKPPPNGPGMQCSNMITYGYLEVAAAATTLTVALKDNAGKTIVDTASGKPCGPYPLRAR